MIEYDDDRGRVMGRGRHRMDYNRQERIEEIKNDFNRNNLEYIKYFNELLKIKQRDEENHLKLLNLYEKANFDCLNIIKKSFDDEIISVNKLINSIKINISNYDSNETKFLNEIKKYDSVDLIIESEINHPNENDNHNSSNSENNIFNILKFDKDSKEKKFKI